MNLHDKTKAIYVKKIQIQPIGEKYWVKVTFSNGTYWIPKLAEQALIAQRVCECEDIKYPHGKGRKMPIEYLTKAMEGMDIKELNKIFKIPERNKQ